MTEELPVELVALDQIKIAPKELNPNQGDIGAITVSIENNDWYGTIVVNRGGDQTSNMILAGNHRALAAKQLGHDKLPVWWVDKTDDEAKAMLLADNRSSALATNDQAVLAELLQDLQSKDMLHQTLYDSDDLDQILADLGTPLSFGDDEVPDVPKEPKTKPGDLYELGEHRLLCGDATKAEDYERLLDGELVNLVVTDPPYGVGIGEKNEMLESVRRGNAASGKLAGDANQAESEVLWRDSFERIADVIPDGCSWYVFGPQRGDLGLLLLQELKESGLLPRHILIWVKNNSSFSLGRLDYEYQHEPIVYGWKPGAKHNWYASETQTSTFSFDRPGRSKEHPTMKPLPLIAQLTRNSSKPNDVILDPFGGSGTTLIVAEQLHRKARLLEIDSAYCDVIVERWEKATGKTATLVTS